MLAAAEALYRDGRRALRAACPRSVLNWREARYFARHGEVEMHLVEFLCRRDQDAIDIGANYGGYVHFLRRHARRVLAFEPLADFAELLRQKFPRSVAVEQIALSDRAGMADLCMPVIDGTAVGGRSTISVQASATYGERRCFEVPTNLLDNVYGGDVGFIKVDIEGHEEAALKGSVETIRRCLPRVLVEIEECMSPGSIARIGAFFADRGYSGHYVHGRRLHPIERFSIDELQNPANQPELTAALHERAPLSHYIYNFIFLPPGESSETLSRMGRRLASLAA